MNDALEQVFDPGLRCAGRGARRGRGGATRGPAGSVAVRVAEPERLELEVDSEQGGVLVLRRAHLAIWRAEIDGVEVPTRIAQLTRLAVEIPAGRHRVRLWIGQLSLAAAGAGALAGLVALLVLAWRSGRPRGPGASISAPRMSPAHRPIRKVLIANRGEIAVRILRALRELDIRGAVIYSDADRDALAVLLADEAYRIGPAPSVESYLRMEAIVDLAVEIGADAIHPGYGFLAERAAFSALCRETGDRLYRPVAGGDRGDGFQGRRRGAA